jgi:gamma-glutamyl-gamma-aminobutyrate hydrolase PuuD
VIDKVDSGYELTCRKTDEIIAAAKSNQLPDQIMFTFHPQRWTDNKLQWTKELIFQNIKNSIKRLLIK